MLTGCKSNDQTALHETNLPSIAILPEASNRVSRVNQENNEIITDNSSTGEPAGANGIRNGLYREYDEQSKLIYEGLKWSPLSRPKRSNYKVHAVLFPFD